MLGTKKSLQLNEVSIGLTLVTSLPILTRIVRFVHETDSVIQKMTGIRPASNGQKRKTSITSQSGSSGHKRKRSDPSRSEHGDMDDEDMENEDDVKIRRKNYEHATSLPRGQTLLSIRGYFGGTSPSAREVANWYHCTSNTAIKAETKAVRDLFAEKLGSIAGKVEAGEFLRQRQDARTGRARFIQGALLSLRWSPDYPPASTAGGETEEGSAKEQGGEASLPSIEAQINDVGCDGSPYDAKAILDVLFKQYVTTE